jgi:hypothetical protein
VLLLLLLLLCIKIDLQRLQRKTFFLCGLFFFLGSSFIFKNGPILGFEPLGEKGEVSEGGRKARWAVF